jgi:hypothetical protein
VVNGNLRSRSASGLNQKCMGYHRNGTNYDHNNTCYIIFLTTSCSQKKQKKSGTPRFLCALMIA